MASRKLTADYVVVSKMMPQKFLHIQLIHFQQVLPSA